MSGKGTGLLYINNFAGTELGGGETHLLQLARAAGEAGYDVSAACLPGSAIGVKLSEAGVRVFDLDMKATNPFAVASRLRAIGDREGASIVHAHGFWPGNLARLAWRGRAAGQRPAVLTTVHCQPNAVAATRTGLAGSAARAARAMVDRYTSKWGDIFIAVSEDIAHQLKELGIRGERIVTIPNGIDIDDVLARSEVGAKEVVDGREIGVVGRLEPVKGVSYLIKAFGLLAESHPELRLAIIGDGSARSALESEVRAGKFADRVRFLGYLDNPLPIVSKLTVYIMPSLSEGLNVTLLEAMALGRPIVATDVGGNPELITDRVTGLLVPARDPKALAAAVGEVLADQELAKRLGEAAARRVGGHFSARTMCDQVIGLYDATGLRKIAAQNQP